MRLVTDKNGIYLNIIKGNLFSIGNFNIRLDMRLLYVRLIRLYAIPHNLYQMGTHDWDWEVGLSESIPCFYYTENCCSYKFFLPSKFTTKTNNYSKTLSFRIKL